jgi:hypothetical protein
MIGSLCRNRPEIGLAYDSCEQLVGGRWRREYSEGVEKPLKSQIDGHEIQASNLYDLIGVAEFDNSGNRRARCDEAGR